MLGAIHTIMKIQHIIPTLLLAGYCTVSAQTNAELFQPKIQRTQPDGSVYYQPIVFKYDWLQFFERSNTISCFSHLMDYDLNTTSDGQLSSFRLILRAKNQQWAGNPNSQVLRPMFKQTIYWDIDGDTVFDAMTKSGESYILYSNSWIRVENSMTGFNTNSMSRGVDTKTRYIFREGTWQAVK